MIKKHKLVQDIHKVANEIKASKMDLVAASWKDIFDVVKNPEYVPYIKALIEYLKSEKENCDSLEKWDSEVANETPISVVLQSEGMREFLKKANNYYLSPTDAMGDYLKSVEENSDSLEESNSAVGINNVEASLKFLDEFAFKVHELIMSEENGHQEKEEHKKDAKQAHERDKANYKSDHRHEFRDNKQRRVS